MIPGIFILAVVHHYGCQLERRRAHPVPDGSHSLDGPCVAAGHGIHVHVADGDSESAREGEKEQKANCHSRIGGSEHPEAAVYFGLTSSVGNAVVHCQRYEDANDKSDCDSDHDEYVDRRKGDDFTIMERPCEAEGSINSISNLKRHKGELSGMECEILL